MRAAAGFPRSKRGTIYTSMETNLFRPSPERCECGNAKSQVAKICLECRRKRIDVQCAECGVTFKCKPSRMREACGRACADKLRAKRSSATQSKKLELVCEYCGTPKLVSPTYASRRFCSPDCAYLHNTGENNAGWKGGVTSEHQQFFTSPEWKVAQRAVWAREQRKCQRCGVVHEGTGRIHEVHHIKSWARNRHLGTEASNLALLCYECHKFVHSRNNVSGEFLLADD